MELRLDYFVAAVEAVSLTVAAPRKLPTPQPSFRRSAHALVPMVTDHRGEHDMTEAKTKTTLQPGIDSVVGGITRLVLNRLSTLGYDSILGCSPAEQKLRELGLAPRPVVGRSSLLS